MTWLADFRDIYCVSCKFSRQRNPIKCIQYAQGVMGKSSVPPIVGSLFSWKSLLTNRNTSDDYFKTTNQHKFSLTPVTHVKQQRRIVDGTFPTAASPRSTSLTLLLGFGVFAVGSDMTGVPKKEKSN